MIRGQKIIVVLPAYNSATTLAKTWNEIPFDIVDEVILTDDASRDNTLQIADQLQIHHIIKHQQNKGYGANQKSCYQKALSLNADIIIMLHPDYQYTPKLIRAMVEIICSGIYPVVLGSRILGKGAIRGGMPIYKYVANRCLTLIQNLIMNQKLSEYHTGFRAYKRVVLEKINFNNCSDDFVFDNEIIAQIFYHNFEIAEITCPTHYDENSSSINFLRSVKYGWGVLKVSAEYRLAKANLYHSAIFKR